MHSREGTQSTGREPLRRKVPHRQEGLRYSAATALPDTLEQQSIDTEALNFYTEASRRLHGTKLSEASDIHQDLETARSLFRRYRKEKDADVLMNARSTARLAHPEANDLDTGRAFRRRSVLAFQNWSAIPK